LLALVLYRTHILGQEHFERGIGVATNQTLFGNNFKKLKLKLYVYYI